MAKTAELLSRALAERTASEWARVFNVVPSHITNARRRGHLSPALAGNFAIEMGESPEQWMLTATLESKQERALLDRLKQRKPEWRKL